MSYLVIVSIVVLVLIGFGLRDRVRFRRLARARSGDSICQFARSFPRRQVEPAIIRQVWVAFQRAAPVRNFPVHATDRIGRLYGLEGDDLDDLFLEVAARVGRSTRTGGENPFYGKVVTVGDLVRFVNAQPKLVLGPAGV